jgi:hypothetical protein
MCDWVLLPDKENPTERRCPEEGEPYCEEHLAALYDTWKALEKLISQQAPL